GVLGAAVLVAAWLSAAPHLSAGGGRPVASLLPWTAAVVVVAIVEEVALRGALFAAVRAWRGAGCALAVTTVAFALLHVPLYGWAALPLDLAAGLLFGGLRLISGGVTAPAAAHVLADLAAGWLV
ncbi:MAG: CPBP family glutamic-type intramembrane protease, partial [Candidatus Dormibacteria bacterium]